MEKGHLKFDEIGGSSKHRDSQNRVRKPMFFCDFFIVKLDNDAKILSDEF